MRSHAEVKFERIKSYCAWFCECIQHVTTLTLNQVKGHEHSQEKKKKQQKKSTYCIWNIFSKLRSGGDEQFIIQVGPVVIGFTVPCIPRVLHEMDQRYGKGLC